MTTSDHPIATRGTLAYRAFFCCTLACTAIAVTYFLIGLADGTVSSFNLGLWLLLLGGLGMVLWTGHLLRRSGRTGAAIAVLALVAVPGLFAGLLVLIVTVTQPRWN